MEERGPGPDERMEGRGSRTGGAGEGAGDGADGDGGMSTGAKVALGCGGLLVLVVAVVGITVAVGGKWIADRARDFTGDVEQQTETRAEATDILDRLRREHPFEPPAEGAVDPDRARRFFRATDAAWEELRGSMEELRELQESVEEEGRPGIADIASLVGSYGKVAESRLVVARALEGEGMSLEEYLWTGHALTRAHEAMEEDPDVSGVPESTREIVRAHRPEIAEVRGEGDREPGKEIVYRLAWMWGSMDDATDRALEAVGADTLLR